MLYIEPIESEEELEKLFRNFKLPVFQHPSIFYQELLQSDTLADIISFAYNECKVYIPERLKTYFLRVRRNKKFETGIKSHIQFAVLMRYIFEDSLKNNEYYKGFNEFIRTVTDESGGDISELDAKKYDFYRERLSSYTKINKYMDRYETEYRRHPLKYQQYYIYYVLMNFDFYPHARKPGSVTYEYMKKYINGLIEFMSDTRENHPEITNYIIERTYNPALIKAIMDNTSKKSELLQENMCFESALSLLTLLPDIENRISYIKAFLHPETYALNQNEYGWGYGLNNLSSKPVINTDEWIENIRRDIVEYALVFTPLLEKYALYLIQCLYKGNGNSESAFIIKSTIPQSIKADKIPGAATENFEQEFVDTAQYMYKIGNINFDLMNSFINRDDTVKWREYKENLISDTIKDIGKVKYRD